MLDSKPSNARKQNGLEYRSFDKSHKRTPRHFIKSLGDSMVKPRDGSGSKPPKMSPNDRVPLKKPARRPKMKKETKNSVLFGKKTNHEYTVVKPKTARRKKNQMLVNNPMNQPKQLKDNPNMSY